MRTGLVVWLVVTLAMLATSSASQSPEGAQSSDAERVHLRELFEANRTHLSETPMTTTVRWTSANVRGSQLDSAVRTLDDVHEKHPNPSVWADRDFEVVGIYRTGIDMIDRARVFLHLADAQRVILERKTGRTRAGIAYRYSGRRVWFQRPEEFLVEYYRERNEAAKLTANPAIH